MTEREIYEQILLGKSLDEIRQNAGIDNPNDWLHPDNRSDDGALEAFFKNFYEVGNVVAKPIADMFGGSDTIDKNLDYAQIYAADPSKLNDWDSALVRQGIFINSAIDGTRRLFGAELEPNKDREEYKNKLEAISRARLEAAQTPERREEARKREEALQRALASGDKSAILAAGAEMGYDYFESWVRGERGWSDFYEILLDPTNALSFGLGGAASKFAKGTITKIIAGGGAGMIEGGVSSAGLTALEKYGDGATSQQAINEGLAAGGTGALIGAGLGGAGAGVGVVFDPKTGKQSGTQGINPSGFDDVLMDGIDPNAPQPTPSSELNIGDFVKEGAKEFSNTPNEMKSDAQVIIDAQTKPFMEAELENSAGILARTELENIVNLDSEVQNIYNAQMEAAKTGLTPQIQPSESLKQWTQIINGNSVTDPRYDGWGLIYAVENEIQAQMDGRSKQSLEAIANKLKTKGLSDNLINLAVTSIQAKDARILSEHIQSVVANAVRENIRGSAVKKLVDDRAVRYANEEKGIGTIRDGSFWKAVEARAKKEGIPLERAKLDAIRLTANRGEVFYNENGRAEKVIRNFVFADDVGGFNEPMSYRVISASDLKPNFEGGTGTQFRYKDNSAMIQRVADNFNADLHFNQGKFDGIPIVDLQGRIIAGNHRAAGLQKLSPQSREAYNLAAKQTFGDDIFDGVNYDNPVIVRLLLNTDQKTIERMSAYSNEGRLSGLGERMKASWGRLAHAIPNLYTKNGKMIKIESEGDLMGKLGANSPDEASGALMVELNPDLVDALEHFTDNTRREKIERFDQVIIQSAFQMWNLKRLEQMYSDPRSLAGLVDEYNNGQKVETDITPFLARAIRKMAATADGSGKELDKTIDSWYSATVGRQVFSDFIEDGYVNPKDEMIGDLLATALNKMMSLVDGGYTKIPEHLKLLRKEAERLASASSFDTLDRYATIRMLLQNTNLLSRDDANPTLEKFSVIEEYLRLADEVGFDTLNRLANSYHKGSIEALLRGIAENGGYENYLRKLNESDRNATTGRVEDSNAGLQGDVEGRTDGEGSISSIGEVDNRGDTIAGRMVYGNEEGVADDRGSQLPSDNDRGSTSAILDPTGSERVFDRLQSNMEAGLLEPSSSMQSIGRLSDPSAGVYGDTDPTTIQGSNADINQQNIDVYGAERRGYTADFGVGGESRERSTITNQTIGDLTTKEYADATESERRGDADARAELQRRANTHTPTTNDLADIEAQLPQLLPAQQMDVRIVENAFSEGRGALLTNGTGTGKTYIGSGVVKRFVNAGKSNILIVTPNQAINEGWIKALQDLQIEANVLGGTKEAPRGVTITTYANFQANKALQDKTYDLVVYDESQKLLENKDGDPSKTTLAHLKITRDNFFREVEAKGDQATEADWAKAREARDESKVLFLSATPFASPLSLRYADGLLFDSGGDFDNFLVRNFGYTTKRGNLTIPDAGVDTDKLQRMFANNLMQIGKQSGRKVDNGFDFSRQFMRVGEGDITRIDEAMDYIRAHNLRNLKVVYNKTLFDYHTINRINESVKAREIIPFLRQAIADGKKIVLFHSYNNGGVARHPFLLSDADFKKVAMSEAQEAQMRAEYSQFMSGYPRAFEAFDFPDPIETLKKEFGDQIVFYNGTISQKQRDINLREFNSDDGIPKIIMTQNEAGSAGISLHDTTGKHQRLLVKINIPTRPISEIQSEGRTYRIGQKSDTSFIYAITGSKIEKEAFSKKINQKVGAVENLANGDGAANLNMAFKQGYLAGLDMKLEYKNVKTKGGVEADRRSDTGNPFDLAVRNYETNKYAKSKHTSNTADPIAFKMAEWADVKLGDKILDPLGGAGSRVKYFNDSALIASLEPNEKLRSDLMVYMDANNIRDGEFKDLSIINKYDAIVMDTPFGHNDKTAIGYATKALQHLSRDGRLVAVLPNSKEADTFLSNLPDDYFLNAEVLLPKEANEYGLPSKIVIIDRGVQRENPIVKDFSKIGETFAGGGWNWDFVKDLEMPPRKLDWDKIGVDC